MAFLFVPQFTLLLLMYVFGPMCPTFSMLPTFTNIYLCPNVPHCKFNTCIERKIGLAWSFYTQLVDSNWLIQTFYTQLLQSDWFSYITLFANIMLMLEGFDVNQNIVNIYY